MVEFAWHWGAGQMVVVSGHLAQGQFGRVCQFCFSLNSCVFNTLGEYSVLFGAAYSIWITLLYNGKFIKAGSHLSCVCLRVSNTLILVSNLVLLKRAS